MLRVHTFGGCHVSAAATRVDGISGQPKTLALLALLAAEPDGVSRASLLAYLWPDSDEERARTALRQLVHALRTRLAAPDLVDGTTTLRLNAAVATSDVADFRAALARGDDAAAVTLHTGPFLEGFHLRGVDEFERWVAATRARLADERTRALTRLARAADDRARTDPAAQREAVDWWRRLAAAEPLSGAAALGLMRALDAAGERAAALRHARVHATLLRHDLGAEPDRAVRDFEEALRAGDAHHSGAPLVGSAPATASPLASAPAPDDAPPGPPVHRTGVRLLVGGVALAAVALGVLAGPPTTRDARPREPDRGVRDPARARGTDSVTYALYLRGRHAFHNRIALDGVRQASRYFAEAVARDPEFAPAHAGLSDTYTRMAGFGYAGPVEALRLAKDAARRALALDSTLAAGHVALAHALLLGDCAWDAAEREFRHALALDPTYTFGRAPYALLLLGRGRYDEALAQLDTAQAVEPLAPWIANLRGRVLVSAGRPNDATRVLEEVLTLYPGLDLAHQQLGHAYLARRMPARAIAAFRRGAALHGARDSAQLAYAYAVTGDREAARQIVRRLTAPGRPAQGPNAPAVLAYYVAMAHAGLGEPDAAFDWLERARLGGAWCPVPAAVDPGFRALHASPRWRLLMAEMGLPARAARVP